MAAMLNGDKLTGRSISVSGESMLTVLMFLASAAAVAPPPKHLQGLVAASDYPPGALDRNEQGAVYFQVIVNPEGRVDNCTILLSSGYNDLDYVTCQLVTKRARFSPAEDEHGKPIYATYRQIINWRISNRPFGADGALPPSVPPDLDLTINHAPPGVRLPLRITLSYFVKTTGTVSHCQTSDTSMPAPEVLVGLACNAVMQSPIDVIRNRDNVPVDASETATVRFSTGKQTH
jgi:TonB family protein